MYPGEEEGVVGDHQIRLGLYRFMDYFNCGVQRKKYPGNRGRGVPADQANAVPGFGSVGWKVSIEQITHIRNIGHIDRLPSGVA